MNWAWMSSLDQLWRSPAFPMWLTLAAAVFFGIMVLITLIRAEKSVANGALTVITLLAVGIAVAATIRSFGPGSRSAGEAVTAPSVGVSLPALACIDDLAGDTVLAACEKILFGSAEATATAVSYAASRLTRLTNYGDVAAASKIMTPELMALRRAIERDRFGLVAQVLSARDHCQPSDCAAYASLTDHKQIAANMDQKVYDIAVTHYAPTWTAPAVSGSGWNGPAAAAATLPPSMPTGKPTNADFPTSASIPPVNIMVPEPGPAPRTSSLPATSGAAPAAAPRPLANNTPNAPAAAAKKPAPATPPKNRPPLQAQGAPVRLAPPPAAADN